jgi:hypothetical protein
MSSSNVEFTTGLIIHAFRCLRHFDLKVPVREVMMKEQKTDKKHLPLNHPFWLVACLGAHIGFQERYTESLCKRMSWIVAQTMARQLVSVVNTSI